MSVLSIRLKEKELARIKELSKLRREDKSTVAKELMDFGWDFLMVKLYRDGKISLGTLCEKLELSMSETVDRLAEFGIISPIEYNDYLKGSEYLKKMKKDLKAR
jgi:hypothetical protein